MPIICSAQASIACNICSGGVVMGGRRGITAAGWVWSQLTTGGGVGTGTGRVELGLHAGRTHAHSVRTSRRGKVDGVDLVDGGMGGYLDFRQREVELTVQRGADDGGVGGALVGLLTGLLRGDSVLCDDFGAAGLVLALAIGVDGMNGPRGSGGKGNGNGDGLPVLAHEIDRQRGGDHRRARGERRRSMKPWPLNT